jgi:hypothetical protein
LDDFAKALMSGNANPDAGQAGGDVVTDPRPFGQQQGQRSGRKTSEEPFGFFGHPRHPAAHVCHLAKVQDERVVRGASLQPVNLLDRRW